MKSMFHNPNSSNLHTHGLHVSPAPGADSQLGVAEPGTSRTYLYRLPCDHMGGTFWYHPHAEESAALQTAGGAFGMLLVEDDPSVDNLPAAVAAMPTLELTAHYFDPRTLQRHAFESGDRLFYSRVLQPAYFVNGATLPTFSLVANQWTRLRILHVRQPRLFAAACCCLNCIYAC